MKAIMISIKPKWCTLIMNGKKTVEVRKNKALANAIQKLIDENGYADIYVYCTKDNNNLLHKNCAGIYFVEDREFQNKNKQLGITTQPILNGKVLFKFRCYKVEEILIKQNSNYYTNTLSNNKLLTQSCLSQKEIFEYVECHISKISGCWFSGYAIHISNLEIFDKPKELWQFEKFGSWRNYQKTCKKALAGRCNYGGGRTGKIGCEKARLTKAPQNFCYIESEE